MRKEWIYGKLICSALFLLGTCLPASAQTGHLSGVRVVNDEIKKNGREVHVNFVLDIEEMHVKRQESVRLYPVVVAKEGGKSLELPSVVLDGRVRDKVHRRDKALTGSAKTDGAYIALRRKNGEAQQVEYAVTLPMSLDGSEPPGAARAGDGMSGVCTVRHGGNAGKKYVPAIVPAAVCHSFCAARERDCEGAQRGACGTFAVPSGQLQHRPEVQEQ